MNGEGASAPPSRMIPRALNAPLSWIGLMRVSEHEAVKLRSAADDQLIRRLTDERDDWKRMANDFGERFNAAEAKCNKALAWAKEQHQRADKHAAELEALRPDALLWRAARLKRRGNK